MAEGEQKQLCGFHEKLIDHAIHAERKRIRDAIRRLQREFHLCYDNATLNACLAVTKSRKPR